MWLEDPNAAKGSNLEKESLGAKPVFLPVAKPDDEPPNGSKAAWTENNENVHAENKTNETKNMQNATTIRNQSSEDYIKN